VAFPASSNGRVPEGQPNLAQAFMPAVSWPALAAVPEERLKDVRICPIDQQAESPPEFPLPRIGGGGQGVGAGERPAQRIPDSFLTLHKAALRQAREDPIIAPWNSPAVSGTPVPPGVGWREN
jgi:hypothetical protein